MSMANTWQVMYPCLIFYPLLTKSGSCMTLTSVLGIGFQLGTLCPTTKDHLYTHAISCSVPAGLVEKCAMSYYPLQTCIAAVGTCAIGTEAGEGSIARDYCSFMTLWNTMSRVTKENICWLGRVTFTPRIFYQQITNSSILWKTTFGKILRRECRFSACTHRLLCIQGTWFFISRIMRSLKQIGKCSWYR